MIRMKKAIISFYIERNIWKVNVVYKVNDNCYMQELVEQKSRNPAQAKSMITFKAVKQMFPFMEQIEYKQEG